jgi:hypothetical protein
MGLGSRVATDLTVTHGGVITGSGGRKDEKEVWGGQADWCDYAGRGVGLMLMPDPRNFRRACGSACWSMTAIWTAKLRIRTSSGPGEALITSAHEAKLGNRAQRQRP